MRIAVGLLLSGALLVSASAQDESLEFPIDLLDTLLPESYNKDTPPYIFKLWYHEKVIEAIINPMMVTSLEMQTMDMEIEIEMHIAWQDNRILFTEELKTNHVSLPTKVATKLWRPGVKFLNCKGCSIDLLNPNEVDFSLEGRNNKTFITVYLRKTFLFMCQFDLRSYPFDVQQCNFTFLGPPGSHYTLKTSSDKNVTDISVPSEYILDDFSLGNCVGFKGNMQVRGPCNVISFTFRREIIPRILITYIPSFLIVVLSWISFWLHVDMAAPRVALGLTSLLTLATQFNNVQNQLPAVACLKAIDIWMFSCMFVVFASLTEYAVANFHYRHFRSLKKDSRILTNDKLYKWTRKTWPFKGKISVKLYTFPTKQRRLSTMSAEDPVQAKLKSTLKSTKYESSHIIDKTARIVFPIGFGIFNIVYWFYYYI